MAFNPTSATVENEGCVLHYWFQGKGPLLILVPGGMGHGRQFNNILMLLDQHFTVVAYDRRQASTNKAAPDKPLNPVQHASDILAIIRSIGQDRTSIFAYGGGGIIALEFAVSYPEAVDHMIIHETPTLSILQDSTFYLDRVFKLFDVYRTQGARVATAAFHSMLGNLEDGLPLPHPESENAETWWANDILLLGTYCPDLRRIVESKVSIAVAAGEDSKEAFYGRTAAEQEGILKCPRLVFPGSHQGFESEPDKFAPVLLEAFDMLEKRRRSSVLGLIFY
jgi:pimeloyl-ACP methyl ester carboxylesterase